MSYVSGPADENGAAPPAGRRVVIFSAVFAMHVGLIALLIMSRTTAEQPSTQGALSVFSVSASSSVSAAVPVALPLIPAENKQATPDPAIVFAEQQAAAGDPNGDVCSPVDFVTAQLASDPAVPAAIDRVPRDDRSISEAIVMWNTEWSDVTTAEGAPLAAVRERIILTLADLPPDCLAVPVIGPRLIAIAEDGGTTTFLAFGSGEWSWQQLSAAPDDIAPADTKAWVWKDLLTENLAPIF